MEEGSAQGDVDLVEKLLHALGYELEALQLDALKEQARRRAAQASDPGARSRAAYFHLLTMVPILVHTIQPLAQSIALEPASPLVFPASS